MTVKDLFDLRDYYFHQLEYHRDMVKDFPAVASKEHKEHTSKAVFFNKKLEKIEDLLNNVDLEKIKLKG